MTPWNRRPEIHLWSRAVQAAGTFDIDVPRPLPLHLRALGVTRMSVATKYHDTRLRTSDLPPSPSFSLSLLRSSSPSCFAYQGGRFRSLPLLLSSRRGASASEG